MKCIDQLTEEFTLSQMYEFENKLSIQFPQTTISKTKSANSCKFCVIKI
ncbi:type II restriction endonuclease [Neisseria gonorrhoeae]|uniref:Type II restriction endonuclease n=1 Tax=Neisseria gonorrhoeae TaxID=485 RepID=A0A378W360_NEIGO|nr:type II restriction endonuclease [Neisseria gonorrhoeae]